MKKSVSTCVLLLLVASVGVSGSLAYATVIQGGSNVTLLWTNSMEVFDVEVAGDGAHLAVACGVPSGLYYFASGSSTPVWWWLTPQGTPISVAVSLDGNQVAVGSNLGYVYYFDNALTRSGVQASSTWVSRDLGGEIQRRTIDMSDDGQYVVVGGTGDAVYYFAGCRARSGSSEDVTWMDFPAYSWEIYAVDLSRDGQYIAVGGSRFDGGFVAFYKQAYTPPFPKNEAWDAVSSISENVVDVKVSDDGYSVAAVSSFAITTLHYWRSAASLSGDPQDTWNSTETYACVDTSGDGDEVVAGKSRPALCGIHYWADARSLTGIDLAETWTRHEGELVPDVAINSEGTVLAAVAARFNSETEYFAYFYTVDGVSLGEFQLDDFSDKVSMSDSGETVAVGGAVLGTLYVFRVQVPKPVGGTVVADCLQALTPFLLYGAAVAVSAIALTRTRRKP